MLSSTGMVKIDDQVEKQASRMADLIVELVEHTDGPVTLARIHRDIPGFAKEDPRVWQYYVERDDGEQIIWDGMTEAGLRALSKVMCGRRVAIQYLTSPLLYLIEGCYHRSENWVPIVLLPAKAANMDTPNWLVRGSAAFQKRCIERAAAGVKGYRWLTPSAVRCTADQLAMQEQQAAEMGADVRSKLASHTGVAYGPRGPRDLQSARRQLLERFRALFQKLTAGGWIDAHENLILCGPGGIGKSWLASVLGTKAVATIDRFSTDCRAFYILLEPGCTNTAGAF